MAAVQLTGGPLPTIKRVASVGTTLQAFTLPTSGARQVSVTADAACWVQFTGSNGDAVTSTACWPLASGSTATFALHMAASGSILVAAQSGTANVAVCVEGAL